MTDSINSVNSSYNDYEYEYDSSSKDNKEQIDEAASFNQSIFTSGYNSPTNSIFSNNESIFSSSDKINTKTNQEENSKVKEQTAKKANFFTNFFDKFKQAKISDSSTQTTSNEPVKGNGKIENTKQQKTGDCYLLSAVNALSYTDEGKKAIKDALEWKDNGDVTVHFKGGAGNYTVTHEEINKILKEQNENGPNTYKYSSGDVDMIALEKGFEKLFDDVSKGKFQFTESGYSQTEDLRKDKAEWGRVLDGGNEHQVMALLTGKKSEIIGLNDNTKNILDNYNGKNVALTFSWNCTQQDEISIKDINGEEVSLIGEHAYAIKDATSDTITVINPWDSSKEIKMSRETFDNNVGLMCICDMSKNDNHLGNIVQMPSSTAYGNNRFEKEYGDYNHTPIFGTDKYINSKKTISQYDEDGKLMYKIMLDDNGKKAAIQKYQEEVTYEEKNDYAPEQKNVKKSVGFYSKDGTKSVSEIYGSNGEAIDYKISTVDKHGIEKEAVSIGDNKERAIKAYERDIISYDQFGIQEMRELSKLNDKDWSKVKNYLDKNKNASYLDLIYNSGVNLTYPSHSYFED